MIPRETAKRHGLIVSTEEGHRDEKISKLKTILPDVITEDGRVDVATLQNIIGEEYIVQNNQLHELRFAGRGVANYLASSSTDAELRVEYNRSKDFDVTSNVMVIGDNLDVLKILRRNYYGSVKAIYIDPPYNTVKKEFIYKDDFKKSDAKLIEELGLNEETVERFQDLYSTRSHSGWLAFMHPRLAIAGELLAEDGVIFISIDDHEQPNLRLLCDKIFGESNFLACAVWDLGAGTTAGHFMRSHEYILVYAKNKNYLDNFTYRGPNAIITERAVKKISRKNPASNITFPKGMEYEGKDAVFVGEIGNDEKIYIVDSRLIFKDGKLTKNTTLQAGWAMRNQILSWINKEETFDTKGQKIIRFFFSKKGMLQYEKERTRINPRTILKDIASTKKGSAHIKKLFDADVFPYPKPTELIKYLVKLVTHENDIVMDFFAGSGTTGEAVMELNSEDGLHRKYILVQKDEKIEKNDEAEDAIKFCKEQNLDVVVSNIMIERLNRASNIIKKEHPSVDTGYKVFSLKSKPKIVDDGSQTLLLSTQHTKRSVNDVLFNMLCATGKPLDVPIETIVKDKLYEVDGEMYVLGNTDLSKYKDRKINVDGWGETNTLEQYLNLPQSNVEIVY